MTETTYTVELSEGEATERIGSSVTTYYGMDVRKLEVL